MNGRRINDVFRMGVMVTGLALIVLVFGLTPIVGVFLLIFGVVLLALGAATA